MRYDSGCFLPFVFFSLSLSFRHTQTHTLYLQVEPKFRLVQAVKGAAKCRLSLVLDVSGSMAGNGLAKMNKGLQKLIRYTLPKGSEVAVSTFGSTGTVSFSFTEKKVSYLGIYLG